MRPIRLTLATALALVAAPGAACDFDGLGGHRYFAFGGMYRGGSAELPDQQTDEPDPSYAEASAPARPEQDGSDPGSPPPESDEEAAELESGGTDPQDQADSEDKEPAVLR